MASTLDNIAKQLRTVTWPFLYYHHDDLIRCLGPLFPILFHGKYCLAITALHNVEFLIREDNPSDVREMNVPDDFRKKHPLFHHGETKFISEHRIRNYKPFTVIPGKDGKRFTANIDHVYFMARGLLDLAVVILRIGNDLQKHFSTRLRISSEGPKVGDKVLIAGFNKGDVVKKSGSLESGLQFLFQESFRLKSSEVISLSDWGKDRYIYGPCFNVNTEIDHGISGGPVFLMNDIHDTVVCGMVSRGSVAGNPEAVASILYPALYISLPSVTLDGGEARIMSLMEMAKVKAIYDISRAYDRLRLIGDISCEPPTFTWNKM